MQWCMNRRTVMSSALQEAIQIIISLMNEEVMCPKESDAYKSAKDFLISCGYRFDD